MLSLRMRNKFYCELNTKICSKFHFKLLITTYSKMLQNFVFSQRSFSLKYATNALNSDRQ